jgi:hypothetical protein
MRNTGADFGQMTYQGCLKRRREKIHFPPGDLPKRDRRPAHQAGRRLDDGLDVRPAEKVFQGQPDGLEQGFRGHLLFPRRKMHEYALSSVRLGPIVSITIWRVGCQRKR